MSKFINVRRGEIAELKVELNSPKLEKRREAIKRVIAVMTVGKDVSSLFMDVLKCVETTNLEMKKLVYLYIINYAKTQPELTLMAVNTFRKDSRDKSNPLIRALAVRTMGCIGVESIVSYLCGPLKDSLEDEDPYVRKTAAVTVAKMYQIKQEAVQDLELLMKLLKMASTDGNPMVVANAVAALNQISTSRGPLIKMDDALQSQLLNSLSDCSEWCKIYILDALATYLPLTTKDAESTIQRIQANLSSSNPAVVLSAVKVIIRYLDFITDPQTVRKLCRKLAQPLVSLMSSDPQIQYVALRNINLIIQKRPKILQGEVRFFFCNYADPVYVKTAKLQILIRLADPMNIDQVLHELRDYSQEVDIFFVKKSVQAIGRCAIKLDKIAERCVHVLLDLIRTKVDLVVQQAIVVIRDIFRKYPNKYQTIIKDICSNLKTLDSVTAKSAMVWIIGEYAERIDNSPDLIERFVVNFKDEHSDVQMQILTASIKIYLKRQEQVSVMVQDLLRIATEEIDNPDLRQRQVKALNQKVLPIRAFMYWRLLTCQVEGVKNYILGEKPTISDDSQAMEPQMLDRLIENISLLSSVYYKPPQAFVEKIREKQNERFDQEHIDQDQEDQIEEEVDSSGQNKADIKAVQENFQNYANTESYHEEEEKNGEEVRGVSGELTSGGGGGGLDNLLSLDDNDDAAPDTGYPPLFCKIPFKTVAMTNNVQNQLQIQAAFQRLNNKIDLQFKFLNNGATAESFALQFNKNFYGLAPQQTFHPQYSIGQGQSSQISLEIGTNSNLSGDAALKPPFIIQSAIRTSNQVLYFNIPILLCVIFKEHSQGQHDFGQVWSSVQTQPNMMYGIQNVNTELNNLELIKQRFSCYNVNFVMSKPTEQSHYFGVVTERNQLIVIEFTSTSPTSCKLCVKSVQMPLIPLVQQSMHFLLSSPSFS